MWLNYLKKLKRGNKIMVNLENRLIGIFKPGNNDDAYILDFDLSIDFQKAIEEDKGMLSWARLLNKDTGLIYYEFNWNKTQK